MICSRDERVSDVVTKQFHVEDIGRLTQHLDTSGTSTDQTTTDYTSFFDTDTDDTIKASKKKTKRVRLSKLYKCIYLCLYFALLKQEQISILIEDKKSMNFNW